MCDYTDVFNYLHIHQCSNWQKLFILFGPLTKHLGQLAEKAARWDKMSVCSQKEEGNDEHRTTMDERMVEKCVGREKNNELDLVHILHNKSISQTWVIYSRTVCYCAGKAQV